jgi:hypothetical protein
MMDRESLGKLAVGNRVDLAKVFRVERELAKLAEAGVTEPGGYKIASPLGRPTDVAQRKSLANVPPTEGQVGALGLKGR